MSDFNINIPVQQGWQCPICKRVYSPTIPMCFYCGSGGNTTMEITNQSGDCKLSTKDYCTYKSEENINVRS